jgi:CheY-like chemotaxis protein
MTASTLNILLADDSADEHFLFLHTMKNVDTDVKIYTVLNGVELIKWLNQPDAVMPDLLFLDLNMPLKNGKETLKEIRKNDRFADLNVLIYSTSDEKRDVDETFALGANLYVKKPQDYNELERTLSKLISLYREKGIERFEKPQYVFSLQEKY